MVDPDESTAQETQADPAQSALPDVESRAMADLPVELEVRLGVITLPLGELLQMQRGSILTMDGAGGEAIELLAGGKRIARGEIVTVDEHLAVRVVEILDSESAEEG